MKDYKQIVRILAIKMYHNYMQGDYGYKRVDGAVLTAEIFDVHPNKLYVDVEKEFKRILKHNNS